MIRDPYNSQNHPTASGWQNQPGTPSSFQWQGSQPDAPTETFQQPGSNQTQPPFQPSYQPVQPPFTPRPRVDPARMVRPNNALPPGPLHVKLKHMWQKDPAYKVLFVSIGVVFLSCLLIAGLIFNQFASPSRSTDNGKQANNTQTTQGDKQVTPTQEVATPTPAPTPTPTPSPTPLPTPTPTVEPTPVVPVNLEVTITSIPTSVQNRTTVPVVVTTNTPGSTVSLTVNYSNAFPLITQMGPQSVDSAGNTTFYWSINETVFSTKTRTVKAYVTARAFDQQGRTTNSQKVAVTIQMVQRAQ